MVLDLKKSCINNTEVSHVPHTQFRLLLACYTEWEFLLQYIIINQSP